MIEVMDTPRLIEFIERRSKKELNRFLKNLKFYVKSNLLSKDEIKISQDLIVFIKTRINGLKI